MADNQSQPEQLGPVMDEFVTRYRRGERPSVTEYAERHPDLADQIRELFPSLVLMERAGSGDDELSSGRVTADGRTLERLGEYRIIREIGRGGMGIVYEAEQESLGRRVAIKVLPFHALMTPRHMKRFQLEARAAAQLHHSNIVPVFGVGEDQGIPYYAMQYIQGLGLDEVLIELRRLRRRPLQAGSSRNDDGRVGDSFSASVASGMLSGAVPAAPPAAKTGSYHPAAPGQASAAAASLEPSASPACTHARPDASRSNDGDLKRTSKSLDDSSGSVVLPGDTMPTSSATSDLHYFRSVAHVGVQVADALAYAHGQGVLHRDVKPSNLLLDMKGCVWVTDFGLAKTTPLSPSSEGGEAAAELTHTGDVVGTLRYMAPERFRGWSDTRSDIYSLGLTLYEMLTLQPAFDGSDRARLVRQLTLEDPPRPRKIDPYVPRDLETIVLKAIAKEPHARYESAADMREDLRRFLDDKPIVARRTSLGERARMWCRRNPLVAGLTAAVALLLITLAVGSSTAALRLKEKHKAALESLERVRTAQGNEREAHHLATQRLFDAYLAQARAGRWSGMAGRRFDSLEALRKAADLNPTLRLDEDARRELRNEAIACMALTDVRVETQWPDDTPAGSAVRHTGFDRSGDRVARLDVTGEIVVRSVRDGTELIRLPGAWSETRSAPFIRYCPNDQFIAACGPVADGSTRVRVWNLAEKKGSGVFDRNGPQGASHQRLPPPFSPAIVLDVPSTAWPNAYYIAFSTDSRRVAFPESTTHTVVHESETGKQVARLAIDSTTSNSLAFCSRGDHLVTNTGPRGSDVVIFSIETGRQERVLAHPGYVFHVAWSRDGRLIAAACADKNAYVWDTQRLDSPLAVCRGHLSQAIAVAFNHDSSLLMSTSYDGTTRLWDPRRGEQLVSIDHRGLGFSDDARWLALNDLSLGYGRCELSAGSECRILSTSPPTDHVVDVAFSADGRLFAAATRGNGVDVWNIASGAAEVARFNVGVETRSVEFTPDGRYLIASGRASVDRWPIDAITSGESSQILARREILAQSAFPCETALSQDGKRLVASLADDVINVYDFQQPQTQQGATKGSGVFDRNGPADASHQRLPTPLSPPVRMKSVPSFSWFVAISPNGRWVAASAKSNGDIPVWDAATGELLVHLRTSDTEGALVSFSSDNCWLVVSEFGHFAFYETGTWREWRRLPGRGAKCYGRIAFSPDAQICAALDQRAVTLYDTATFCELATLSSSRLEQLATGYPEGAGGLSFSPDGSLLAVGTMKGTVQLWDLRSIRTRLADMGLDWQLPSYPPAPSPNAEDLEPIGRMAADLPGPGPTPAERLRSELQLLNDTINANPDDVGAHERRAELLYTSDHTDEAIAAFSRLIELKPDQISPYVRRATLLTRSKNHKAAISDYESALKIDANSALVANNLAWLYATGSTDVRSPEKALPLAKQAVGLQPNDPNSLNTLGVVYYRLGEFDKAIETLEAATKANSDGATAFDLFFLAMSWHQLGNEDKSQGYFERALEWWRHQKDIPADWAKELTQFCQEAAALLADSGLKNVPGR